MARRFSLLRAAVLGLAVAALWAGPALAVELLPHRALYRLKMASADASSGVADARGSMAIEWAETCEGWTMQQRIRLKLSGIEEEALDTDMAFTSWESADSLDYRFSMRSLHGGQLDEELRGQANLVARGGPGSANFFVPPDKHMKLPAGTLFPTDHTLRLIQAAEAGEKVLLRVVFDGATPEGAAEVNAVIGRRLPPEETGDATSGRPSWHLRLAYFDLDAAAFEPHYELSVRLYDNGVVTDMVMDYGDFTLNAVLDRIEALPPPEC